MKEGQGGLIFGQPSPEYVAELRRDRRRKAPPIENVDVYAAYLLKPLIKEAVLDDSRRYSEERNETRYESQRILQKVWGETVSLPSYLHPSILARCLKWAGYEVLEEKLGTKPAPRTFEAEMGMKIGSSAHFSLLRILRKFGVQEQTVLQDETGISGRLDFMIKNPVTKEFQILDLKFTGDWAFRKVKREGLPDYLRKTKGIYNPRPEDRLQLLIYMGGRRQEGLNVAMGNIVYINRDSGEVKECLVPWDSLAEHDMDEFLENLTKARKDIEKGELPEPTVVSAYICASMCPYRLHCDYGQKFAAGAIKREAKRRPLGIYYKARREREGRSKMMEELGIVQAELPLPTLKERHGNPTPTSSLVVEQEFQVEQKQDEAVYHLGVAETLKGISCWDCGEDVTRFCTKVGDRRGNKVRIRVKITCPLHGSLDTKEKTVSRGQVVEYGQ